MGDLPVSPKPVLRYRAPPYTHTLTLRVNWYHLHFTVSPDTMSLSVKPKLRIAFLGKSRSTWLTYVQSAAQQASRILLPSSASAPITHLVFAYVLFPKIVGRIQSAAASHPDQLQRRPCILGEVSGESQGPLPTLGLDSRGQPEREGSKTETPLPDISLPTPRISRAMVSSGEEQPSFLARGAEYTRLLDE